MDALDNKCPACSAKIKFNPVIQKWDCEYCGNKFTLEEMQKYENASNEKVNIKVDNLPKEDSIQDFTNYRCKNCGAEIMADETIVATSCVYCGSTAILKEKIESGKAPDLIIPFKNIKEDAVKAFTSITKYKPFMPKEFKKIRNIENISGIYIPFWAYDITGDGDIDFDCTDVKTWSDSKYMYTKTDRYLVTTTGHFEYEKVLADASSRFKDELMDSIEPFDFNGLIDYNHAYLSGFLAEKYDVLEDKSYERASDRTMNTCIDLCKEKAIYGIKSIRANNIDLKKNKVYQLMLPVWMVNINFKGKIYTFAMNGQTGKMVGDIPIDKRKLIAWIFIIFIVSFLIGYGFMSL